MLKAHTALMSFQRFVEVSPDRRDPYVVADIDPLLADTHAFKSFGLLRRLASRPTALNEESRRHFAVS